MAPKIVKGKTINNFDLRPTILLEKLPINSNNNLLYPPNPREQMLGIGLRDLIDYFCNLKNS